MAKINPMALVDNMSGKVCEHSNVSFRTIKQTGAVYSQKLCHPFEGEPSSDQIAKRNRFANVAKAVRLRLANETAEEVIALKKAFRAQHKVGSLFGFAFAKWNSQYDATGALITPEDED